MFEFLLNIADDDYLFQIECLRNLKLEPFLGRITHFNNVRNVEFLQCCIPIVPD